MKETPRNSAGTFVDANGKLLRAIYSEEEVNLFRQWFNAVRDVNPGYLDEKDYALARRLHYQLGMAWHETPPPAVKNMT